MRDMLLGLGIPSREIRDAFNELMQAVWVERDIARDAEARLRFVEAQLRVAEGRLRAATRGSSIASRRPRRPDHSGQRAPVRIHRAS